MGVDNSGVLVVGEVFGDKTRWTGLPLYDQLHEYESLTDLYYQRKIVELELDWRIGEPVGYEASGLFGFCLESPSYGVSQFDYQKFVDDLNIIQTKWEEWTGRQPVVWLMNLQS